MAADFDLLAGGSVKQFAAYQLPEDSFLYLLHAIAQSGPNAQRLIEAQDWHMYLMDAPDVEHELLRLHQYRRVNYEVRRHPFSVASAAPLAMRARSEHVCMSDWQERLTADLEPKLRVLDPRPLISAYHDMPYAIFRYSPEESSPSEGGASAAGHVWNRLARALRLSLSRNVSLLLSRPKAWMQEPSRKPRSA